MRLKIRVATQNERTITTATATMGIIAAVTEPGKLIHGMALVRSLIGRINSASHESYVLIIAYV